MTRIVGLDNEYMTVWYCPETGIVQHVMHRFVISAAFRQGLEAGLALLSAHQASKWLFDDRKNGPLSDEDASWAQTDFQPRAIRAGWRYWAMVMPEGVLGQMKVRRHFALAASMGLTVRAFSEPEEAAAWLAAPDAGYTPNAS